jgi:hypothetical protein
MGSPLKKVWNGEKDHRLIIINDDGPVCNESNSFLNLVFSRIREYEYREGAICNPFHRHTLWKNIRIFAELKHRCIIKNNNNELRVPLLSAYVYKYACIQEALFSDVIRMSF